MGKPAKVRVFEPNKVSSNALRRMKADQYNAARNKRYEKAAALKVEAAEILESDMNLANATNAARITEIRQELKALNCV